MIETIIKRNGMEEPFVAKKLNDWSKWAGEGNTADWSSIVMQTVSKLPNIVESSTLQEALIEECLKRKSWSAFCMAGRLYAPHLIKTIFPDGIPTLKDQHRKLKELGLMDDMGYTDYEYVYLESVIDHRLDYDTPHFSLDYINSKYALQNRVTKKVYETQQFVYMRMAMAIASTTPPGQARLELVEKLYDKYSHKRLSAPSPNYINMGTKLKGFASCCLYAAGDTVDSIGIANFISYRMTATSAGLGNIYAIRSLGDPVRGGAIPHTGKLPYLKALAGEVKSSIQAGRSGACTTYYSAYDPESDDISQLRNPRSVEEKRNRELHYAIEMNKFFARKIAKNEDAFSFNIFTAPDLYKSLFSNKPGEFERLYEKYENDPTFEKHYFSPRKLFSRVMSEGISTGVAYLAMIDEMNRHTPFKEPILTANLCMEVSQPTHPFYSMPDLYKEDDTGTVTVISDNTPDTPVTFGWSQRMTRITDNGVQAIYAGEIEEGDRLEIQTDAGTQELIIKEVIDKQQSSEVSMCSLAAINVADVETDEEYEEVMYLAYKQIDYCILNSVYPLPNIAYTAKQRMNAAVGIMGLATLMARKGLKYNTKEGLEFLHSVAERHMYFAIKASLRISKERGLAPWIHKTKWVDGWTPLKSYERRVDELGDFKLQYDWDALSEEIKENGGLAHSSLVAYMPGESSSKALGQANSIYPVRETVMIKTDNKSVIRWAAPHGDNKEYSYQSAWDLKEIEAIHFYAIFQKFTDQTISADWWRRMPADTSVGTDELIKIGMEMVKYGMKTRYYYNTKTTSVDGLTTEENINDMSKSCASGACTI